MIHHFRSTITNIRKNALILGPSGTGKTLITRFFLKNIRNIALETLNEYYILYFNGVSFNIYAKIIRYISEKLCWQGKGFSKRLFSRLFIIGKLMI